MLRQGVKKAAPDEAVLPLVHPFLSATTFWLLSLAGAMSALPGHHALMMALCGGFSWVDQKRYNLTQHMTGGPPTLIETKHEKGLK